MIGNMLCLTHEVVPGHERKYLDCKTVPSYFNILFGIHFPWRVCFRPEFDAYGAIRDEYADKDAGDGIADVN
jgi:hypothetical protein